MPINLRDHVSGRHGEGIGNLISDVASVAVQIESLIRRASLSDTLGAYGHTNVQGEQQQKLDVLANNLLVEAMRAQPAVSAVVSEEDEKPIVFPVKPGAKYIAIFDPLDGSSNIDVNVNVGTIVSIQRMHAGGSIEAAALQAGNAQVAAVYVNYGPATMLVYTAGSGTHGFTLNDGEFLLSAENMSMPDQGPYYSVNEGNVADFPQVYRDYIDGLRSGGLLGPKYSARYVGSFIADFHRTLLKGGIFFYPPTAKTPSGKLRLLYEANPLAFIAEQAGGMATTGGSDGSSCRIVELVPSELHQRTTIAVGSRAEVEALTGLIADSMAGR